MGDITNDEEFARRLFLSKRNFDYEEELLCVRRLFITAANDVVVMAQHAHVALLMEGMPESANLFLGAPYDYQKQTILHREYARHPEVFCVMEAQLTANVRELLNNVLGLVNYANECLSRIGRSYKRVPLQLGRFLPIAMENLPEELVLSPP